MLLFFFFFVFKKELLRTWDTVKFVPGEEKARNKHKTQTWEKKRFCPNFFRREIVIGEKEVKTITKKSFFFLLVRVFLLVLCSPSSVEFATEGFVVNEKKKKNNKKPELRNALEPWFCVTFHDVFFPNQGHDFFRVRFWKWMLATVAMCSCFPKQE